MNEIKILLAASFLIGALAMRVEAATFHAASYAMPAISAPLQK